MDLSDKVAIITGASRGIGREIALRLARAGAKTVVAARHLEALESLREEMLRLGLAEPFLFALDVSQDEQIQQLVDKALDKYRGIDILVNNAGVTRDALLVRMTESEWDDVLNTNLRGTFLMMRSVSKVMMRQRRGRIINVASVVGLVGNPGQANYAASKAGIIALTKTVARELASRNVLVNAVAPGFIDTEMTRNLPESVKSAMLERIPLKRFGTAENVAEVVHYLASDLSGYITGQVITVDGGMVM